MRNETRNLISKGVSMITGVAIKRCANKGCNCYIISGRDVVHDEEDNVFCKKICTIRSIVHGVRTKKECMLDTKRKKRTSRLNIEDKVLGTDSKNNEFPDGLAN